MSFRLKYLKYKNKYIELKNYLKVQKGGNPIDESLLNTLLELNADEIQKYKINCGKYGSLSGKDIWLSSFDPIYEDYLFKLKKCSAHDTNWIYTLYIKKKDSDFNVSFN